MQEINFMVAAFDSGIPQLSATALVTASIINVNDNDPVFSQTEYFASIKEHSPLGTFVTEVKAEDKDLGEFGSVSYKLIGDYSILFTIDEGGKIQVGPGAILDRENISLITIHVVASDDAPEEMAKTSVSVPVSKLVLCLK